MPLVTCHTPGCANADVPIDMRLVYPDPDTGEDREVDAVVCGVCGETITDVKDNPEDRDTRVAPDA